jgi:hypothetical protein
MGMGRRYSMVEDAIGGVGSDMRLLARDSAEGFPLRCYYEKAVPSTEYLAPRKGGRRPEPITGKKIRDQIKAGECAEAADRRDLPRY